jgi:hypothetical protein
VRVCIGLRLRVRVWTGIMVRALSRDVIIQSVRVRVRVRARALSKDVMIQSVRVRVGVHLRIEPCMGWL